MYICFSPAAVRKTTSRQRSMLGYERTRQIRIGDKLIAINGKSLVTKNIAKVRQMLLGPPDSSVVLHFRTGGGEAHPQGEAIDRSAERTMTPRGTRRADMEMVARSTPQPVLTPRGTTRDEVREGHALGPKEGVATLSQCTLEFSDSFDTACKGSDEAMLVKKLVHWKYSLTLPFALCGSEVRCGSTSSQHSSGLQSRTIQSRIDPPDHRQQLEAPLESITCSGNNIYKITFISVQVMGFRLEHGKLLFA
jgi:hypothetical protein